MIEVIMDEQPFEQSSAIPKERQDRYTTWKKNTKLLYEYLNTNSNKWPSLTCQFFPDVNTKNDSHRILLSSFTSSLVPEDESLYITRISTLKHLSWASLNNFDLDEMEFKPDNSNIKLPPKNLTTELVIRFPNGDCNRARYLPQNPDLIAAASSDGSVYIFDRTKHGTAMHSRQSGFTQSYQAKLAVNNNSQSLNGENEALTIDWNHQKEGHLVVAYSDGHVKAWDITKYKRSDPVIKAPEYNYKLDESGCNDAVWMPEHNSLFAACSEDNRLSLFDTRDESNIIDISTSVHKGGINACRFNPRNSLLLASGDSIGNICLWDIRKKETPINILDHGSSISTIEWNPNLSTVLASAGQDDGLVKLWDAGSDKPVFIHGGHMLGVNDISWNMHDPWLMCSVSKDNSIQIWKPAHNLVELE
ncbi:hypothetical protein Kpol_1024p39 [Vanderwaltozyma polyspora DSM 70294]|uniref:Uncharacterized protein n=1 Tax=Vanderwaltozyma polyspora (strain ATCC 22028 / DSM 70294 / BCRC 21397 / CBS 2163 / NBRC 10782 / NRRL Y-8283 / UCD 57-17) TaxID=436907 RepID=A7TLJ9_VANPO|nr:uncharacterized protein Kpol_1024p39 [Vanderwaltozyma polyspora DSM 70294]EDO16885.1 hypothetical protein Kpol_1024p39 [Vanderwaltozyma polyspora DSM 70294]